MCVLYRYEACNEVILSLSEAFFGVMIFCFMYMHAVFESLSVSEEVYEYGI